jgi:hypothetical protein
VGPAASATEVEEDVDGGPSGGGALSAGPAAATAEVEDDVDGEPPGGRCRRVRQQPPTRLNRTSIASPLEMLPVGQAAAHQ